MLRHEDELHLDLRTLTFRFTQPRGKPEFAKEIVVPSEIQKAVEEHHHQQKKQAPH